MCKITHLFLTHQPTPQLRKKQKKHVVFLGFSAHLEPKNFLKFFHLENFSTSSICGLILIIEGHGGSLDCKRGWKPFFGGFQLLWCVWVYVSNKKSDSNAGWPGLTHPCGVMFDDFLLIPNYLLGQSPVFTLFFGRRPLPGQHPLEEAQSLSSPQKKQLSWATLQVTSYPIHSGSVTQTPLSLSHKWLSLHT